MKKQEIVAILNAINGDQFWYDPSLELADTDFKHQLKLCSKV